MYAITVPNGQIVHENCIKRSYAGNLIFLFRDNFAFILKVMSIGERSIWWDF